MTESEKERQLDHLNRQNQGSPTFSFKAEQKNVPVIQEPRVTVPIMNGKIQLRQAKYENLKGKNSNLTCTTITLPEKAVNDLEHFMLQDQTKVAQKGS